MNNIYKAWKKIEDKFGIDAWEQVRDFIWKLEQRLKEMTKSRDNWKKKYMSLRSRKNR